MQESSELSLNFLGQHLKYVLKASKGAMKALRMFMTCDLFRSHWDWKDDRISMAENRRMESKKMFTLIPLDPCTGQSGFKKDLSHESAEIQKSAKNNKKNIETYAKRFSQQILATSACPDFPLPGSSLLSYPTAYMHHELVNLSESTLQAAVMALLSTKYLDTDWEDGQ